MRSPLLILAIAITFIACGHGKREKPENRAQKQAQKLEGEQPENQKPQVELEKQMLETEPIQSTELSAWRLGWVKKVMGAQDGKNTVAVEAFTRTFRMEFDAKYANRPFVGIAECGKIQKFGHSIKVFCADKIYDKGRISTLGGAYIVTCDQNVNEIVALRSGDKISVEGTIDKIVKGADIDGIGIGDIFELVSLPYYDAVHVVSIVNAKVTKK